jgi:hypothetical protein
MSELTRRRDTARNAETWLIFLEDVHIGTIGRRAGVPTDAEQWGWRCGFLSGSRRGARAEGRLRTSIRRDLNLKPLGAGCGRVTPTLTSPTIAARAWTAWKQAMWERGRKLPTQIQEGRARCFCGAEIDIANMDRHVTAPHMTEPANV